MYISFETSLKVQMQRLSSLMCSSLRTRDPIPWGDFILLRPTGTISTCTSSVSWHAGIFERHGGFITERVPAIPGLKRDPKNQSRKRKLFNQSIRRSVLDLITSLRGSQSSWGCARALERWTYQQPWSALAFKSVSYS